MEDALAYSSNTAFAQLGVSLGDNAVSSMAKKLGFDSPITVDGSDYTGTPWVSVTSKFPTDIIGVDRPGRHRGDPVAERYGGRRHSQ